MISIEELVRSDFEAIHGVSFATRTLNFNHYGHSMYRCVVSILLIIVWHCKKYLHRRRFIPRYRIARSPKLRSYRGEKHIRALELWDSVRLKISCANYQVNDIFIGASLPVKNSLVVNEYLRVLNFGCWLWWLCNYCTPRTKIFLHMPDGDCSRNYCNRDTYDPRYYSPRVHTYCTLSF